MNYIDIKNQLDTIMTTLTNNLEKGETKLETKALLDLQKALEQSIELEKLLNTSEDNRTTEDLLEIFNNPLD